MITNKYISKRIMSLFIIISLFIFSIFLAVLLEEDNNNKSDMKIENKFIQKPNSNINTDNSINTDFKSHLPIVVIDTYGENIKADILWDDEKSILFQLMMIHI
ncbi:hypothetical protein A500_18247 [Clostridium sartagoforme AAU1]|uniref:Uncharacterized protein n=2 Tax=Clostridium sartagoforme TaxID=84031 RepID=R9BT07_9CLOT|nr:hypothetical protein A500_18247 [Clostridium sartagoforme AAU1]